MWGVGGRLIEAPYATPVQSLHLNSNVEDYAYKSGLRRPLAALFRRFITMAVINPVLGSLNGGIKWNDRRMKGTLWQPRIRTETALMCRAREEMVFCMDIRLLNRVHCFGPSMENCIFCYFDGGFKRCAFQAFRGQCSHGVYKGSKIWARQRNARIVSGEQRGSLALKGFVLIHSCLWN